MNAIAQFAPKYLFIRVQEACNAGCFMCDFANSRDDFRYDPEDLQKLVSRAPALGYGYVRFTGGEPLMHKEIDRLISIVHASGLKSSVITNGKLLPRKIESMVTSGLDQVIVSIDSSRAPIHDSLRDTRGSFANSIEGLRMAKALGIHCRVNTVVGPHNYLDMPRLQVLLSDLGVDQWELSALKLDPMPPYSDVESAMKVGNLIYSNGLLRPTGRPWFGETDEEINLFFANGTPPRPRGDTCFAARDITYLDAKNGEVYPCSCLPHRPAEMVRSDGRIRSTGTVRLANPVVRPSDPTVAADVDLEGVEFASNRAFFMQNGPQICTNCSTTSTGYSDVVASSTPIPEWSY